MAKRTNKSIILEYFLYGYSPEDIAEIEGFNLSSIKAYLITERSRYTFKIFKDKKNYFERLKIAFSEIEMDYGTDLRLYQWDELDYEEQRLTELKIHNELRKGYGK